MRLLLCTRRGGSLVFLGADDDRAGLTVGEGHGFIGACYFEHFERGMWGVDDTDGYAWQDASLCEVAQEFRVAVADTFDGGAFADVDAG